ncbi:hypothetical protein AMEX_G1412 [Astyanax mexicanus]|uniref:Uncharacterized protein n=1 Tax=Astyanax mexicanus TaxID=7994 RepID=A0A8T2MGK0_ASTMX|nr:hypothetical protein AMEX_G1412 [Astyanax mexicanus]
MDAQDAEARIKGGAAIGRERCSHRKLWALLLTHTLLTGGCIACCVFTLQRPPDTPGDRGIYLNLRNDHKNHGPKLNFTLTWSEGVELYHGSELKVQYPGPYIFYVCASLFGESQDRGKRANLTLQQGERKTSIELQADVENLNPCVRHERLISLYEEDVVTFSFHQQEADGLNLKLLRVGLHYMLGKQHFKTPDSSE